ncbi:MAG: 50S ribosomal protein L11 methyltransferase [Sulfurimonadaceae bacterium]
MLEFYYELRVKPKIQYDIFLDLITSLTNEAIEEDDGVLILRSEDDLSDIEFGIKTFAKQLNAECETKLQQLKNEDWVNKYKQSIDAVQVGVFYILPTWKEPKEELVNIFIDPSLSFGSGHHETTSNCLIALDKYVQSGQTLVDVGCGSGILAIAASKLGAQVDICDTDENAIKDAKENFNINETFYDEAWVGSISKTTKKYDIVVANIVADVLAMIASDLKKCMKENGILILSGILDKHLSKVENKYKDLKQIEVIQKNEWVTLVYTI